MPQDRKQVEAMPFEDENMSFPGTFFTAQCSGPVVRMDLMHFYAHFFASETGTSTCAHAVCQVPGGGLLCREESSWRDASSA